jgi:Zn-dependent protease
VHPLFWLCAALLGGSLLHNSLLWWLVWIGVVFVAILVHELGHALAYRFYGCQAAIILWMFGGLTITDHVPHRRGARLLVTLAGPLSGFAVAAMLYITARWTNWLSQAAPPALVFAYILLIQVNLYWGVFNLLPVLPLDGGQVCRELCEAWRPGQGLYWAWQISLWTAAVLTLYSILCWLESTRGGGLLADHLPSWFPRGDWWTGLLFGVLAWQSYQQLQHLRRWMH